MARLNDERAWVKSQTNCPLLADREAGVAEVIALEHGFPLHNEHWKNWDSVLALAHTTDKCDPSYPVLDAGACRDPKYPSAYLPGLCAMGYRDLTGVNLDEKETVFERGVHYMHGDITHTSFQTDHFGFVACLSVIEHGVPVPQFLHEMARIIQPGGYLFVSFDYWHDPIDCGDRKAFGAPVHVFDKVEVLNMVALAEAKGLVMDHPMTLHCQDKVVKWLGLEYTFMNLLLRRVE